MNRFLMNILLGIVWMFLSGDLEHKKFIEGFIIGFIIIWITKYASESSNYIARVPKLLFFVLYFFYELVLANLKITVDVLTPKHRMKPSIIAIPLSAKSDFEITLLANLITLTPGSLSIDVSSDRKVLYVHSMYVDDPEKFKNQIKNGFERKLLEITR